MTNQPPTQLLTSEQKAAFGNARQLAPRLTDKGRVRELLGPIREKLNAGWSYEEVRQELAKTVGFKGTLQTLYRYVWQLSSGQTQPNAPTAPSAGPPDQQAATLRIPAESAPAQPDGEPKPNSGRNYIQSLGGEHARAARQQAKEAQAQGKRPSLIEILNRPL